VDMIISKDIPDQLTQMMSSILFVLLMIISTASDDVNCPPLDS
jgi:hypothetical protein